MRRVDWKFWRRRQEEPPQPVGSIVQPKIITDHEKRQAEIAAREGNPTISEVLRGVPMAKATGGVPTYTGTKVRLSNLMVALWDVSCREDARRYISQGYVSIGGRTATGDHELRVNPGDVLVSGHDRYVLTAEQIQKAATPTRKVKK